jgi:hypothetical protein
MSGARTQVGIIEWEGRTRDAREIEMRLAAALGAWVPKASSAAAKLLLARHARHHAWHAELWDALIPVLHDVPVASGVNDSGMAAAVAALRAAQEAQGLYDDVIPHVVATYRSWAGEATPIAERPIMRVLDLVLGDLDFDAQEGHELFSR